MANKMAKDNSTVLSLNVNCFTANGPKCKTIYYEAGFHADIVKSYTDMRLKEQSPAKLQPKVTLAEGELKIEGLNCKTTHGVKKKVVARAPKYLSASKGIAKPSHEQVVFGRSR